MTGPAVPVAVHRALPRRRRRASERPGSQARPVRPAPPAGHRSGRSTCGAPLPRPRLANGRTTAGSGSAARSASGTPAANASSSASSYSSVALVGAHQMRTESRPWRVLSQYPPAYGLAFPFGLDHGRRRRCRNADLEVPMIRTESRGLANAASRASADVGRASVHPKRVRRVSIHLPTRVSSIGALVQALGPQARSLEHPRPLGGNRAPPLAGSVGEQADGSKEGRGAGVSGHPPMVPGQGPRYGAPAWKPSSARETDRPPAAVRPRPGGRLGCCLVSRCPRS